MDDHSCGGKWGENTDCFDIYKEGRGTDNAKAGLAAILNMSSYRENHLGLVLGYNQRA
jgi:hypothetical protein